MQGIICKLVDPRSKKVVHHYEYSSFGEPKEVKSESNPWRYSGKRHDDELKLINYGKRYYDAEIGRFLTPDPAGFLDSVNLYQYAFNNPYSYYDPNGEFIFLAAIPFAALLTRAAVKIFVDAIVAGVATWGAYETGKVVAKEVGSSYTLSEFGWRAMVDSASVAGMLLEHAVVNKSTGTESEKKSSGIAQEFEKNPDWEETTDRRNKSGNHREFKNKKTGERVRCDKGDPTKPGHKGRDHYHKYNPNKTGRRDKYLDKNGNPVGQNSPASHLYLPKV